MPWTKTRKPITHRCATPFTVDHRDVGDEWTCAYCGQVWVVVNYRYGGGAGRKELETKIDRPRPPAGTNDGALAI